MRYVRRSDEGSVVAASRWPNERTPDTVADNDPDLQAFLNRNPAEPWPPLLAGLRSYAIAAVDRQAEERRCRWITKGDGQALAYEAKRRDAVAWAAATSPHALADYPWMQDRAARLNDTTVDLVTEPQMQAVADEWLARIATWRATDIAIEAVREQAKENIAAATDAAAVRAVLSSLVWPLGPERSVVPRGTPLRRRRRRSASPRGSSTKPARRPPAP